MAPSDGEMKRALRCMALMTRISRRLGAACVLFGSYAQDTPLNGSDLDVALTFQGRFESKDGADKPKKLRVLEAFSSRVQGTKRLKVIEEIFEARVPILRLQYGGKAKPPLAVDLSIGNSVTGVLDSYIREEIERRPECYSLVLLAKFWARRRNVNKALLGCLNSLSWTLLVLCFAALDQEARGPLREAFAGFLAWVRAFGERPSPGRKLSVLRGRWVPYEARAERVVLWIEDPTAPANNTAHCLRTEGWRAILQEVDRGLSLLRNGETLGEVCSDGAPSRVHLAPPALRGKLAGKRRAEAAPAGEPRPKVRKKGVRKRSTEG